MNRKTRAILSVAVLLSLGTAAPVWAAEAPPAPQVQQQEPDFVTTADQAIRERDRLYIALAKVLYHSEQHEEET